MTDFVLVLATVAGMAGGVPAPLPVAGGTGLPQAAGAATMAEAPFKIPRRTFGSFEDCTNAMAALSAPAGVRLVCLPSDISSLPEAQPF